jgi:hypothetical protein
MTTITRLDGTRVTLPDPPATTRIAVPGTAEIDDRANARRIARSLRDDPLKLAQFRDCSLRLCATVGTTKPQFDLAVFLLGAGEWHLGWAELARWHEMEHPSKVFHGRARWDGRKRLDGRTLLVRIGWDGLGDLIMLWRLLPMLAEQTGARLVLECRPTLERLARRLPGVDEVCLTDRLDASPPPFDVYTWSSMLPHELGVTPESFGSAVPYIQSDPALVEHWRARLPVADDLRVGLVWGASTWGNLERNMPLAALAPLGQIPGIQLIGLQKSVSPPESPSWREAVPNGPESEPTPEGMELLRLGPKLQDMDDTAAVMSLCDAVVSVDTAPAHLSGALGRPTLLMLRKTADWRWEPPASRTPWYPSMRLFRQDRPGDWSAPVARAADELRRLVAERGAA